jgi:hypothetical protein
MKKIYGVIFGVIFILVSRNVLAETDTIEQVQGQPVIEAPSDPNLLCPPDNDDTQSKDYQKSILSNKDISEIARTKAITGNGGNTATIIQNGNDNNSNVSQSGNNNYASHTQNGDSNTITLDQKGNDNSSCEKQTGKNNRKTIIQNGKKKETIILEQVGKEPIK